MTVAVLMAVAVGGSVAVGRSVTVGNSVAMGVAMVTVGRTMGRTVAVGRMCLFVAVVTVTVGCTMGVATVVVLPNFLGKRVLQINAGFEGTKPLTQSGGRRQMKFIPQP